MRWYSRASIWAEKQKNLSPQSVWETLFKPSCFGNLVKSDKPEGKNGPVPFKCGICKWVWECLDTPPK